MSARILRHHDRAELVDGLAGTLITRLVQLQEGRTTVNLCLTGGELANEVYARFAELVPESGLDPHALALWWSDERFLPTTAPERNSLQSLSILARTLRLSGSQTHPMPTSEGHADPDEAAFAYADELGETVFDVCLLGVGGDGHVASLYPGHPAAEPTSSLAVGVTGAPVPPPEQMSLSLAAINRSRRVWLFASGEGKADAVAGSARAQSELPAGQVAGTEETLFFVDEAAASRIPTYECRF